MNQPLVILTRTEHDNQRVAPFFEEYGHQTRSCPVIEIRDLEVDPWDIRHSADPYVVLLTSSRSTVRWLGIMESLLNLNVSGYLVVGVSSVTMLRESDPDTPVLMYENSIEELLETLDNLRHADPEDSHQFGTDLAYGVVRSEGGVGRVLYPCSAVRREETRLGLLRLGFDVLEVPLYEPVVPSVAEHNLLSVLRHRKAPVALPFFSPSAVRNCMKLLRQEGADAGEDLDLSELLNQPDIVIASIGETTAESLYSYGVEYVVVAPEPDVAMLARHVAEALAEALEAG